MVHVNTTQVLPTKIVYNVWSLNIEDNIDIKIDAKKRKLIKKNTYRIKMGAHQIRSYVLQPQC